MPGVSLFAFTFTQVYLSSGKGLAVGLAGLLIGFSHAKHN